MTTPATAATPAPAVTTPVQPAVTKPAVTAPAVPAPASTTPAVTMPAVPATDMRTPVQPAIQRPARLPYSRGAALESWFDAELRPVLIQYLGETARQHEDHLQNTFASIRHWLNELPGRAHQHGKETQAFAKAMADELRGRLGDA